jgi:aryl-alcohol dehydrogenase-like predicted oxidoreductase
MKASGRAKLVGISIQSHQPTNALKALDSGLVDSVQVIYNIFDQSPEDELFPYCQKNSIGVIARVPFDEGSLSGQVTPKTKFPKSDFRNNYFSGGRKREAWERVQAIATDLGISMDEMPEIALRFCLSHPAVSTVIPGMRNTKHVAANTAASDAGPLPEETLRKLREHRWVRNYW